MKIHCLLKPIFSNNSWLELISSLSGCDPICLHTQWLSHVVSMYFPRFFNHLLSFVLLMTPLCVFLARYWMVLVLQAAPVPVAHSGCPCLAAGCGAVWDLSSSGTSSRLNTLSSSVWGCGPVLWALWHPYNPNIMPHCKVLTFILQRVRLAGSFTLCSKGNYHAKERAPLHCLKSATQSDPLWCHCV